MRVRLKRILIVLAAAAVALLLLFVPGLPWSARHRHTLHRAIVKTEMKLAKWRGVQPRLVSIAGRVNTPAARIDALDSKSGWAALADRDGRFVLPDVMWYPGASYELVISNDESIGRIIKVSAPAMFPEGGVFSVGELDDDQGKLVALDSLFGMNSVTLEGFDSSNGKYYK